MLSNLSHIPSSFVFFLIPFFCFLFCCNVVLICKNSFYSKTVSTLQDRDRGISALFLGLWMPSLPTKLSQPFPW
jgi:hypothetical protein